MEAAQLFRYLYGFPLAMLQAVVPLFLPMAKRRNWYVFLLALAGLFGGCIGAGMLLFNPLFPAVDGHYFFGIFYLAVIASIAASIRLMCGCSWSEAMYVGVFTYIVEHLLYCVQTMADYLARDVSWWNQEIAHPILMIVLYICVWQFFARPLCADGHYPVSSPRSIWLLMVEFALMYAISIRVSDLGLSWLHASYMIICIAFIFISERHWVLQTRAQETLRAKEKLWEMNKAQYELTRENIDIINRKCHDLRHQMDAMRLVAGEDERQQVMDSMRQVVRIYDTSLKTGNQSLDTVLMQKGLVCNENGISMSIIADGKLLDFMDPVDLYTMTANILDNAIEANLRIPDQERRAIHLKLHAQRGLVILQEENPCEERVVLKDGFPVTSKADKANHGIGTRSIAATAEQYGGVMRLETGEKMFVLRLIFPPQELSNQDEKSAS